MKRMSVVWMLFIFCLAGRVSCRFELESDWGSIQIHGFISQGFLTSEHNSFFAGTEDGTFQFNEVGMNFSTDLSDRLRAGVQIFSRDLGSIGNNEIEIDWAYGDYRWKDRLGFRFGKIKSPYGLYNETRDLDMLRTSIFLPGIYHESWRDTYLSGQGIGIYGYVSLASLGGMNYQILYGEPNLTPDSSIVHMMEDNSGMDIVSLESSLMVQASLEWYPPLEGLRVGGTVMTLDMDMEMRTTEHSIWGSGNTPAGIVFSYKMENTRIFVCSAEYSRGNWIFASEYMRFLTDASIMDQADDWNGQDGYYASMVYRLTDWWEVGAYYSIFYSDIDDREGKKFDPEHRGWQKELVLTTRFDLDEFWTFKLEGHFTNGTTLMLYQDNPDGFEEDSFLLAIKTTFNF